MRFPSIASIHWSLIWFHVDRSLTINSIIYVWIHVFVSLTLPLPLFSLAGSLLYSGSLHPHAVHIGIQWIGWVIFIDSHKSDSFILYIYALVRSTTTLTLQFNVDWMSFVMLWSISFKSKMASEKKNWITHRNKNEQCRENSELQSNNHKNHKMRNPYRQPNNTRKVSGERKKVLPKTMNVRANRYSMHVDLYHIQNGLDTRLRSNITVFFCFVSFSQKIQVNRFCTRYWKWYVDLNLRCNETELYSEVKWDIRFEVNWLSN